MKLLGALGFDFKIFLIQTINFLLLFLILNRLFFQPFIKALRREKADILRWQNLEQKLAKEKEKWQKQKKEEKLRIVKQAESILAEAQQAAQTLKQNVYKQAYAQADEIIEKSKVQAKILKQERLKKAEKFLQTEILAHVTAKLSQIFKSFDLKEVNEDYFVQLLKKLNDFQWPVENKKFEKMPKLAKLPLPKPNKLPELKLTQKHKTKDFLPTKLQYSHFFSHAQKEKLSQVFKEKFGQNLNLQSKQNSDLIIGYCLEVKGIILEVSLRKELEKS